MRIEAGLEAVLREEAVVLRAKRHDLLGVREGQVRQLLDLLLGFAGVEHALERGLTLCHGEGGQVVTRGQVAQVRGPAQERQAALLLLALDLQQGRDAELPDDLGGRARHLPGREAGLEALLLAREGVAAELEGRGIRVGAGSRERQREQGEGERRVPASPSQPSGGGVGLGPHGSTAEGIAPSRACRRPPRPTAGRDAGFVTIEPSGRPSRRGFPAC